MAIKTPTPTQEQINQLRNRFIEKYKSNRPAEPFHPVDIDRIENGDIWCMRFLEMYDLDMQVSFDKLWETCIWRQQNGANDLSKNNLRMDYLKDGVVFTHNKDVDGCPLLIFKTKLHNKGTKDMDEVMRVVVYWIERIQREQNMSKVTVFFDMAGTGLAGMDMEFVKRIIETFKLYYPNSLNYILIYEMAWVLNAAFKIIKGFLPAKALEILKMITKKDINMYIDQKNCLASWGGSDNYEFTFVPEPTMPKKRAITVAKVNGTASVAADDQHNGHDKKVHFANSSPTRVPQMKTEFEDQHSPQAYDMLRLTPNEFIYFTRGETSESTVELACISKFPVTYKIQTTSPEKFRVRPRCGVLGPNETVSVSILLKPEHHLAEGNKDKFLVMCMPVPQGTDPKSPQIAEVWKQKGSTAGEVEQHRLCCTYKAHDMRNGYGAVGGEIVSDAKSSTTVADLSKHAKHLENQIRFTQLLQCVSLVFLLALSVAVVYLLKLETSSDQDDGAAMDCAGCGHCPRGKNL